MLNSRAPFSLFASTFFAMLFVMVASACPSNPTSPGQKPTKAAAGAVCKTNLDCESALCFDNKCAAAVDCAASKNQSLAQCQQLACSVSEDCPSNYYCDLSIGRCLSGQAPPCKVNADCGTGKWCLTDDADASQNACVNCIINDHCETNQICEANECVDKDARGCTDNAQCKSQAVNKICKRASGECVQCMFRTDCAAGTTCRNNKCESVGALDCTAAGVGCSVPSSPICDPTSKQCVPCDLAGPSAPACPNSTHCDAEATSLTKGQCVPDGPLPTQQCASNQQCQPAPAGILAAGALPAGSPAGSYLWCDLSGNPKSCKPCRTATDCGAGAQCQSVSGTNVCVPSTNTCASATDCANVADACVNQSCQTACTATAQCRTGRICDPSSRTCVLPAICTDNASCTANGSYSGLACKGSPKTCQPCAAAADCAQSPNARTVCDQTTKTCVAATPPANQKPDGSLCQTQGECASGLCIDIGLASPVCATVCTRNATTSASANDCATTPHASLTTARSATMPALSANKGFSCSVAGPFSICIHADDVAALYSEPAYPSGAFQTPAGVAPPAGANNYLFCQAGVTTTVNSTVVCDQTCGTTSDCSPGLTPGGTYSCADELVSVAGSFVPSSYRSCVDQGGSDFGDFCSRAADCRENFCDGRCVASRIKRTPSRTCSTNSNCTSGDICVSGYCYRTTVRTTPASCLDDSDCATGDNCWNGKCYMGGAVTSRLCQDGNSCEDPQLQFCAGRCAMHCNTKSDCAAVYDDTVVCGYVPGAPGLNLAGTTPTYEDGFVGESWTRICRGTFAAPTNAVFDHELAKGAYCINDTECQSEVCVDNECTNYCGRSKNCTSPDKCTLVSRRVDPVDTTSPSILMPVCLPF